MFLLWGDSSIGHYEGQEGRCLIDPKIFKWRHLFRS